MVDLLDNFLNPLKVFLALASDLASNQVRDEWKKLQKVFAKIECYKKRFNHATSPKSLAQVIHTFRKLSGHTIPLMTDKSNYR